MSFVASHSALTLTVEDNPTDALAHRRRAYLQALGALHETIICREVARETLLSPPLARHLSAVSSGQPRDEKAVAIGAFIAALFVSKWRWGLPVPGFVNGAVRLGRFAGEAAGPDARLSRAGEFNASAAFWAIPCPTAAAT
jgi:hypothetical protein